MSGIRGRSRLACAGIIWLCGATPNVGGGQVVTPRTVPVQQSGQFDIFPSQRAGMAGVSIALDDTLLDPFVNPAKAVRVRASVLFGGIGAHAVSEGGGGGRTIPIGGLFNLGAWSGGGLFASQRLDLTTAQRLTPGASRSTNRYLSGLLARRIDDRLSVGVSGYAATLDHLDGLDLLYFGSDRLEMTGRIVDLRAGLLKQWDGGRALELVLLHGHADMSHDVRFPAQAWDPNTRQFTTVARQEHNDDRTRMWGAHAEMTVPFGRDGGRVGGLLTANRLSHPKIPNYPLANLPRDPGTTYAFNAGVGLARSLGTTSAGLDIVYEPIRSHTWAEAEAGVTTDAGGVIPAGGKTVENWFRFSNLRLRAGATREFVSEYDSTLSVRVQAGLALANTRYRLRQRDNVQGAERALVARWTEWGPTLGVALRTRIAEFGYVLQVNCSPDSCDPFAGDDVTVSAPTPGTGVIASPSGPVSFRYGRALTHRFTVTLARR